MNGRLQEATFGIAGRNKIPDAQEMRLTEEAEFYWQMLRSEQIISLQPNGKTIAMQWRILK